MGVAQSVLDVLPPLWDGTNPQPYLKSKHDKDAYSAGWSSWEWE